MDFGEEFKVALLKDVELECPFHEPAQDDPEEQPENIERDDVNATQKNSGGVLGKNLASGSPGRKGYIKGTPHRANDRKPDKRSDSTCGKDKGERLTVERSKYPYIVAAHHLIPGNGSLMGDSPSQLFKFMRRNSWVKGEKHKRKISKNIGYCVNGAHNGVWLPGNYAIRAKNPEVRKSWSKLLKKDDKDGTHWCYDYMIAAVCEVGRQFHDSHSFYNKEVKAMLGKLATVLTDHVDTDCKNCKGPDILPPYKVKKQLYAMSDWLRQRVEGNRHAWKMPFLTSNRFKNEIHSDQKKFLKDCEKYESTSSTEGE